MFINSLLLIVVFNTFCKCDLEVTDTGLLPIQEDDMAIIFYLTLKNQCDRNLEISVVMNQCCDQTKPDENVCNMYLIGGYMGVLKRHEIRNVTLINPNLYYYFRKGTCSISVWYRSAKYEKVLTQIVDFRTNATDEDQAVCPSFDMDPMDNCNPVDCVIKYFGEKSYFNPITKECECVPSCLNEKDKDPPEIVVSVMGYSWLTNECINLNNTITKYDLEYLENNQADFSDDITLMNNAICHHGELGLDGDCLCAGTWRTSLFEDDVYEPSLPLYHMCNIEPGGWNCVNRNRIEATALIIAILAITVASKLLILMCILNWCYTHFKKSNKKPIICTEDPDNFDKSLILSDMLRESDKCICADLRKARFSENLEESVDISYYPAKEASVKLNIKSQNIQKCPDYSINLSNTTSSTSAVTFESESDGYSGTTDYEIDFTGEEEEECICPEECPMKEEEEEEEEEKEEEKEEVKEEEKEEEKVDPDSTAESPESKDSKKVEEEETIKKLQFEKTDSSEKLEDP